MSDDIDRFERSEIGNIAEMKPIAKINRDMKKAMMNRPGGVTDSEARFLVDLYYLTQKQRIRLNNQTKGLDRDAKKSDTAAEPHECLDWVLVQSDTLESQVKMMLGVYVSQHPMAWFFEQTLGIGPVIAAGLLAHIDITRAPTAGHIWRFAGLDPRQKWEKGQKRPWNAQLKTLAWKAGDSFVKLSGREDAVYGRLYKERKKYEWAANLYGANVAKAADSLTNKRYGADTDASAWLTGQCSPEKAKARLEAGEAPTAALCKADEQHPGKPMLPPAHIDARARRYAVKMFLSHLHECWWRQATATEPPKPFAIAIQGHAHYIAPPQRPPVDVAA